MAKTRVFLDSSVIITALLSTRGGSFYILSSLQNEFEFQTNEYGLREIQRTLTNKFSHQPVLSNQLFLLLGTAGVRTLPNPSKRERSHCARYISANDAPILASAFKYSDILLTLDKEFFNLRVASAAREVSVKILTPKEFIELFRN